MQPHRTSKAVLQETQDLENVHLDSADDMHLEDEEVSMARNELTSRRLLQRCETCGRNRSPHHFKSESKAQCTQCFKFWIPSGIRYQKSSRLSMANLRSGSYVSITICDWMLRPNDAKSSTQP